MALRAICRLFQESAKKFRSDQCPRLRAALAFYTALSLSPLLLAVVAIAGFVFGEEAARGELVEQMREVVGQEGATVIEQLVARSGSTTNGIIAAAIAFGVMAFGASGVFAELHGALNTVWQVPGRRPVSGVWPLIKSRLLSLSLVCGVAFLLLASLVVSAILSAASSTLARWMPGMDILAQVTNFIVTMGLLTLLFAMIFQWLPETDLAWSHVWVGATITAASFSVGKYLIGLYLGRAAVGSAYAAAGVLVVLLVWIYYSTQIVLFGAELTFVYARRFGRGAVDGKVATPDRPTDDCHFSPAI